jgi:hypothetical protein
MQTPPKNTSEMFDPQKMQAIVNRLKSGTELRPAKIPQGSTSGASQEVITSARDRRGKADKMAIFEGSLKR